MSGQKSDKNLGVEGQKARISADNGDNFKDIMKKAEKYGEFPELMAFKELDGSFSVVNLKKVYDLALKEGMSMAEKELLSEIKALRRAKKRAIWMGDREIEMILTAEIHGVNDAYRNNAHVGGSS